MPDNEMVWVPKGALTDIGDAIREKLGVASTYKLDEMPDAIDGIGGGITPTGTIQITTNGTHDVTEYADANVNVQPNLQSKTVNQNGTVTPDQGYDGLSSVVVDVEGGGGASPVVLNIRGQAFISSDNTINWDNAAYPSYQQFWMDLAPYLGKTLTIINTGNRNYYGFTSVEPYDGLALNAPRVDSGGRLTVTYTGGSDRYLVYDYSTTMNGSPITISVG